MPTRKGATSAKVAQVDSKSEKDRKANSSKEASSSKKSENSSKSKASSDTARKSNSSIREIATSKKTTSEKKTAAKVETKSSGKETASGRKDSSKSTKGENPDSRDVAHRGSEYGLANKPSEQAAAQSARSVFFSLKRTKAAIFNTDYKTRPAGTPSPPSLAGHGINGRNLPIGGEDQVRLAGLPSDYMPTDLVLLPKEYCLSGQVTYLRYEPANSLCRLFREARRCGLNLEVYSGFRDINHQRRIYSQSVSRNGRASGGAAKPGKSEHMLGTTVDVTCGSRYVNSTRFAQTAEGKWLRANAGRYGWRFTVASEPWHIRYFGSEGSSREHVSGGQTQRHAGPVRKVFGGIGRLFGRR